MSLIMKMINTFEYINSSDIPSSKTSMQNYKVQLQKFIANIKIDNVKIKFLIDTRSSAFYVMKPYMKFVN